MTNDVAAAGLDDDTDDVAARMSEARVRRLPIVDERQKLCGIVSLGDLTLKGEEDAAEQALEGVSRPGGQHQQ